LKSRQAVIPNFVHRGELSHATSTLNWVVQHREQDQGPQTRSKGAQAPGAHKPSLTQEISSFFGTQEKSKKKNEVNPKEFDPETSQESHTECPTTC